MALTDKLSAIGDAIREKTGGTGLIPLADMPEEIRGIEGGGSIEIPPYSISNQYFNYQNSKSNLIEVLLLPKLPYNCIKDQRYSSSNTANCFYASKDIQNFMETDEEGYIEIGIPVFAGNLSYIGAYYFTNYNAIPPNLRWVLYPDKTDTWMAAPYNYLAFNNIFNNNYNASALQDISSFKIQLKVDPATEELADNEILLPNASYITNLSQTFYQSGVTTGDVTNFYESMKQIFNDYGYRIVAITNFGSTSVPGYLALFRSSISRCDNFPIIVNVNGNLIQNNQLNSSFDYTCLLKHLTVEAWQLKQKTVVRSKSGLYQVFDKDEPGVEVVDTFKNGSITLNLKKVGVGYSSTYMPNSKFYPMVSNASTYNTYKNQEYITTIDEYAYCFTHDAYIDLFNSLPSHTGTGTCIIQLSSTLGKSTDQGNQVELITDEEKAIVTEKGWTVTIT